MSLFCDLHVHSNSSDGSFAPSELIEIAKSSVLKAVALCDHNNISGLEEFEMAAEGTDVIAVPGVEVTTMYNGKEVHILGLFLRKDTYKMLEDYFFEVNLRKNVSNIELAKKLNEAGYEVDYDEIKKVAGKALPNRVHFAKALMSKGYIKSIQDGFEDILKEGGKFYVPPKKLDSLEAIGFLKSIEAVTVMAHPFLSLSYEELEGFLPKAKENGLIGMEVIYPLFSEEDTKFAYKLAEKYGLLKSGGSDFHGTNKPDIKMGTGRDNIKVPFEFYEKLYQMSQIL